MNKNPLKTLHTAHPAVLCHALVFGFAPLGHRALIALASLLWAEQPQLFASVEPILRYLLAPVWLYLFIRSVNAALALPCHENTRRTMLIYRIVLIVLLLSMLSLLAITLMQMLLAPLLPTR